MPKYIFNKGHRLCCCKFDIYQYVNIPAGTFPLLIILVVHVRELSRG